MGLGTSSTRAYVRRLPKKELAARVAEDGVNASVAVGRQFGDRALIRVRSSVMAADRAPSADAAVSAPTRFERDTPITSPRSRIVLRWQRRQPQLFFEPVACSRASSKVSASKGVLAEQTMKLANLVLQRPMIQSGAG
jgi:hypothetical protein